MPESQRSFRHIYFAQRTPTSKTIQNQYFSHRANCLSSIRSFECWTTKTNCEKQWGGLLIRWDLYNSDVPSMGVNFSIRVWLVLMVVHRLLLSTQKVFFE